VKKQSPFRDIPVIIDDEHETKAKILVMELQALTGLPFILRKARYGVRPSMYRAVLSFNGALKASSNPNVIHLTFPATTSQKLGVTGREQLSLDMQEFAGKIHNAYFS